MMRHRRSHLIAVAAAIAAALSFRRRFEPGSTPKVFTRTRSISAMRTGLESTAGTGFDGAHCRGQTRGFASSRGVIIDAVTAGWAGAPTGRGGRQPDLIVTYTLLTVGADADDGNSCQTFRTVPFAPPPVMRIGIRARS